jgi:hypothetical protein
MQILPLTRVKKLNPWIFLLLVVGVLRTTITVYLTNQEVNGVKEQLPHGQFRDWLTAEFDWSVRIPARFMQVATQFKCAKLPHLNIAVFALYGPRTEHCYSRLLAGIERISKVTQSGEVLLELRRLHYKNVKKVK